MGSVQVAAIRDGRTLILADGRELRLAGIETNDESKTALQALAEGRTLQLKSATGADQHDRYGRLTGFAFADGTEQSLQARLLEQGAARVSARVNNIACAQALLAIERKARESRRGLWADAKFAPLQANERAKIQMKPGHFVLVEGKVLSARQSGGIIYLNFGRHWTHDFSAAVPRSLAKNILPYGVDLLDLERHRVLVRGWIEMRRGPVIVVDAPAQIEVMN